MTVGELICELVTCGNMDAEVYIMTAGDLETVEDDLGTMVYLHGKEESPEPQEPPPRPQEGRV